MVRWLMAIKCWEVQLLVAGCLLLAVTAGCGSPVSDKSANAELRAEIGKPEDRTGTVQPRAGKSGKSDPVSTTTSGSDVTTLPSMAAPRDDDDPLNIPKDVAKDLGSSDARDRFRALDHWEKKDNKAPMDPVFDALADEDPAVRDKAAAIIERLAEAGEERE